jgi:hypothetical protein
MSEVSLTGGCQCGAVRFRAGRVGKSAICHCRMCQKAYGSYFGPLVFAPDVTWTRGVPKYFRSSSLAQRGFCGDCGTPLCFLEDDGTIELSGGAFDDPSAVPPTVQYNLRHKVPFFDGLPDVMKQPRVDLELEANAKVANFQHPDRDTEVWP